jgi:NADH pyrophosphatase NudC (nudix superfamily)
MAPVWIPSIFELVDPDQPLAKAFPGSYIDFEEIQRRLREQNASPKPVVLTRTCNSCSGTGRAICSVCHNYRPNGGNSAMPDPNQPGTTVQCRACQGWGYNRARPCATCDGLGKVEG